MRNLSHAISIAGLGLVLNSFATTVVAQTPEEQLRQCFIQLLDKYQPISRYTEEHKCDVGNKRDAFNAPPSRGPYPISIRYPGFIFLDAQVVNTYKVNDGGHTEPYISPRRDEVSTTMWCRAEDKLFGGGGHYHIRIEGNRQRVATSVEQRKVLQECSEQVQGLWSKSSKTKEAK